MLALKGNTALVTGAGVRLGREIALALAAQGCRLVLHSHASQAEAHALAAELRASGTQVEVLQADLSQAAEASALAARAWDAFGGLDILVNNAAIFHPTALEALDAAEFDRFIGINLKAPYLLSAEIGRRMKQSDRPRSARAIVNIACLSAYSPWKNYLPYSISKAGVVALTEGLAKLLAPEVRVNAVAPGTVLPPPGTTPAEIEDLRRGIPVGHIGTPQDVCDAVVYLCSAPFVTGHTLIVDGGRHL